MTLLWGETKVSPKQCNELLQGAKHETTKNQGFGRQNFF